MKNEPSKILSSGSLAYDLLYSFPGVFQNKILPDPKGNLSIAFNVTNKAVHFGGCAGNIVFNAKLLKEDFILSGIAGKDFGEYEKWLACKNIDVSNIIIEKSEYTSQASVVTDKKGQQITFFYEGAAGKSAKYKSKIKKTIRDNAKKLAFAIVSPNNKDFVLTSIEGCVENYVPFFFDPGQIMPLFSASELIKISKNAAGLFLNEYELELFKKMTKLDIKEILKLCRFIIVTLAEKGSRIHFQDKTINIPALKLKNIKDPTGCGDAYRAGFLIGIKKRFPLLTEKVLIDSAKLGTNLAAACLVETGTQNHKFKFVTE